MRIPGQGLTHALKTARRKVSGAPRTSALTAAALTPLMLAAAVGASAPDAHPVREQAITPLAAVAPVDLSGPAVISVKRAPTRFRFAETTNSAPPPPMVVSAPGTLRIPAMALSAYRNAEVMMARAQPNCGVSWNLLAGIGRIESMHANGGATDSRGTATRPIYGPTLDGTLPGNEVIVHSTQAGRTVYARAMGPMQFIPGTWSRYASDGDGDGKSDPQNLYDSTLAAARYLCSGGLNLRDPAQVMTSVLRYNNSVAYARNVLGWAASYATGVEPVNLPAITGSVPELVTNAHLDGGNGIGPDFPMTAAGLPAGDPLALLPLNLSQTDVANRLPVPPAPPTRQARPPLHRAPSSASPADPQHPAPVVGTRSAAGPVGTTPPPPWANLFAPAPPRPSPGADLWARCPGRPDLSRASCRPCIHASARMCAVYCPTRRSG